MGWKAPGAELTAPGLTDAGDLRRASAQRPFGQGGCGLPTASTQLPSAGSYQPTPETRGAGVRGIGIPKVAVAGGGIGRIQGRPQTPQLPVPVVASGGKP